MKPRRIDSDFSQLVGLIYQGALEEQPWQSALPALREALDAQVISLVLRPPTADDQGVILNCVRPDEDRRRHDSTLADPNDWEVSAYREQFEKAGFLISGSSPDGKLVELIELADHPFFMASQFHPEFHSKPHQPHPLFRGFIAAAQQYGHAKRT